MSKTLLHRLFGLGKIPARNAAILQAEEMILIDEGIGGSITLKHFKAPGKRHSWRRNWFTGSIVLTRKTFAAFTWTKPLVFVPLDDERLAKLEFKFEPDDTLLMSYDASLFNADWSGIVELRFRSDQALLFLEHLKRHSA
ncbi:MAG: hypothetical protein ABW116_18140 [Candidatus Sedimenticola sp. 20ELBAFRAG]